MAEKELEVAQMRVLGQVVPVTVFGEHGTMNFSVRLEEDCKLPGGHAGMKGQLYITPRASLTFDGSEQSDDPKQVVADGDSNG